MTYYMRFFIYFLFWLQLYYGIFSSESLANASSDQINSDVLEVAYLMMNMLNYLVGV